MKRYSAAVALALCARRPSSRVPRPTRRSQTSILLVDAEGGGGHAHRLARPSNRCCSIPVLGWRSHAGD